MKIKTFVIFSILIIGSFFSIDKVFAQQTAGTANIQYPVKELGNCKSETDCKTYCDKSENVDVCLNFAQKNNLMSEQEIARAKKFLAAGSNGPGGCEGKDACEEYCNDISHIDECISFAEKNNLIPPEELAEAKKVQASIKKGVMPPPCGNKKSCDAYCDNPEHMEECITFGIEAGFIQGKELEDVQKMLQAVKRGVKPPPCKGKEACDEYCSAPENMEVCMNFAMEAGFMSEQEKADSQKMLQALKKGIKPPPCKGKDECDVYCQQDDHFKECTDFAVAAGFMSEKDAEMARKTGGKGPGGCKSKDECDAFCNNPDNQETCFNFAKDNGMMPEEDLKRMEEGKKQMKQTFEQMPSEVQECLNSAIGADMVEKMRNGFMPPKEMGDTMQGCFQKMGPPPGQENQNFQPGPGTVNPGGQMMPQQAGPGGCKGPEECEAYCGSNPDECKNFQSGPNQQAQQQFAPGTGPAQCEGENCPPPRQNQNQQGIEGTLRQFAPGTRPMQCAGADCPQQPPPPNSINTQRQYAPGTEPNDTPPPPPGTSTSPGTGGNLTPGQQVPQVQPIEQTVPSETSPPSSFIINTDSLVGSLIYAVFNFLTKH